MSRKKPDLLTQQARLRRRHREKGQVLAIFRKPMWESLTSVLPITAIVLLLCFTVTPVSNNAMMAFLVGSLLLIVGMGLFSLGSEMSMIPLGEAVGKEITRSKKVWIIVAISFLIGVIITVAEPDLQVLASQVPAIENNVIIWSVALGVGVFLVIALLRILLGIPLSYLLIGFYAVVFTLAMFVSPDFWSIAFDSGGVTTGPMTVPFIMALGVGVSAVRNDKHAGGDSFGLVALCSIGPILTVLLLGLLYKPDGSSYTPVTVPDAQDTVEMFRSYTHALPEYFKEILVSLAPIAGFFLIFQLLTRRLNRRQVMSMIVGFLYTYLGLVLFLTGVNVGFMPVGNFLGQSIASLECSWVLIPIAMVIGYFIVAAEPAVHILNRQVEEITAGSIPASAMNLALSLGVSVSLALAMIRVLTGISIMWFLLPGYALSLALSFVVPKIFTSIAFDSGGVASGPMTATFLLPFAMGACDALGGNVVTDAFGVVAMVAMTPLNVDFRGLGGVAGGQVVHGGLAADAAQGQADGDAAAGGGQVHGGHQLLHQGLLAGGRHHGEQHGLFRGLQAQIAQHIVAGGAPAQGREHHRRAEGPVKIHKPAGANHPVGDGDHKIQSFHWVSSYASSMISSTSATATGAVRLMRRL